MPQLPPRPALVFLLLALAGPASWALAQAQSTPPVPAAAAPGTKASAVKVASGPSKAAWAALTPAQQQALAPLSGTWGSMSDAQKRKWLALSRNYPTLPPSEQAKLQSGMSEWVALSPHQRTQARLNFAETKALAPDDKKAKWEAYKALPPEQKRKLAADAGTKTPSTAAAVKPVPPQKLATVPAPRRDARTPRIAVGPQTEGNLMLHPGPAAPPAPSHSN